MPFRRWATPIQDLTRSSTDTIFSAIAAVHDLGTRLWRLTLEQSLWAAEENRRAAAIWVEACRHSGETLQQALEAPFLQMCHRPARKRGRR
jgi:hypothetical protein